jgi:hypothetical protein
MDNKLIATKSANRMEEVRRTLRRNPEHWPKMAGMNGTNPRWLRAFARGQIRRPPADRFLSVELWLINAGLLHSRV